VVVEIEAGLAQALRLLSRQHAECHAGLHSEALHGADHLADLIEVAVPWTAPRRCHAEARRAGRFRALGSGDHIRLVHQPRRLQPRVIMRALRAIAAILGTPAGLDAEEARGLHVIRIEVAAVNGLGTE
jgi:hypothetical protein